MRIEWPTIALAALIYGGWAVLTLFSAQMPAVLSAMLGAWLIAWHSSLQHELLHGHPTSCSRFNHAIGFMPLSLWLPYNLYHALHLAHHSAEALTDPFIDPESYYWTNQSWTNIGPLGRFLVRLQTTLLGRLLIGPAWNAMRLFKRELTRARENLRDVLSVWIIHLIGCVAVLYWIISVCGISPCFYLFAIVYPGTSLSLVRSFAEHRAAAATAKRTAIVENAGILGLLFLFNNLHVVHHDRPNLPWYRIPACYRKHRAALIATNGGLVYDGYFDVARRFLFKAHDLPIHPFVS